MPSLGESLIRRDFVAAFIYVVDVELVVGDDEVGAGPSDRKTRARASKVLASEHRIVTAEQKFAPFPNIPECAKGAVLHGDPNQGASTILVKSTGACTIPSHWHTPNEQVMIANRQRPSRDEGRSSKTPDNGSLRLLAFEACARVFLSDGLPLLHHGRRQVRHPLRR